jgi:outer membrane receptor protein involved in Fe transport
MSSKKLSAFIAIVLLFAVSAFAQTTANLTGTVTQAGSPLPGVTVTISSPALQGVRTAYTDVNGNYNFRSIPPGEYTVRFEMEGMQTVSKSARVGLAQTGRADTELALSSIAESITVTASAPAVLETTEVQTNVQAELVENLPLGRTLAATTALAPGVNVNGPNAGAITISGALAADNLFMVNGAVTNENLRGQSHTLFIEDAIQETTVQTAAISAEFGRFAGGVVNAITKSGGNEFSGSFRDSFNNPDWTSDSPIVIDRIDDIQEVYEGTLGGRIVRDRLWFFGAGRYRDQATDGALFDNNTPYSANIEELRYEAKLTGAITSNHNLMMSYLDIELDQINNCFIACYEFSNLDTARSLPNDFFVARYNGILTDKFLLEASYAQKGFAFEGSGGDSLDRVEGTWGYDANTGAFFGAPVFCGICDPEERNNDTWGVKATYFLATRALGTHNIVAGYEDWSEERLSNNYQSGSNFGINVYSMETAEYNAAGQFLPFITAGDVITYWPIEQLSAGSNMATQSIFLNDKWDFNQNLSFNLGVRYDANDGKDSSGRTVADDSAFSPRLGAIYDLRGDGRYRFNASYSKYVNRIAETVGGSASAAGTPASLYYEYQGPTISGLPTFEAFQELFNWFDSVGGVNNTDLLVYASIPGLNTQITDTLVSPNVDEITVGFGMQLGANGFLRTDLITREWNDFFVTRLDRDTGIVEDEFGQEYDLSFVENSDELERSYDAIQLQAGYRLGQRWNIGGNYTWSETKGNQTGQTGGSGPVADNTSYQGFYPEFKAYEQFNPTGFLPQDQTHKVRAWVSYDLPSAIGNFNFSLLQNFDSGTPYSALGLIDARPYVDSEVLDAYANPPSSVNYYFSDRGGFRWDDTLQTDFALNYTLPIRKVGLFFQGEVLNLLDNDGQIGGNTTVLTARNASCIQDDGVTPCAAFNPFTETPVEGVHWQRGANFGNATAGTTFEQPGHYQLPRTYRFSVGARF